MSAADLSPFLILAATVVVALISLAFVRKREPVFWLSLAGLVLAWFAVLFSPKKGSVTPLFQMDVYGASFMLLILLAAISVVLFSRDYLRVRREEASGEYYVLLVLATLGALILAVSSHMASFFLGIEILSISLYILIAYPRSSSRGLEAGIKYLVLAGTSSAFLLFGMALIFAQLGTLEFAQIFAEAGKQPHDLLVWAGTSLILVGVGFKLALAPFHLWTPDVYEGAPAPITAFIATVSKGAVFALLLRFFLGSYASPGTPPLFTALSALSILSMFIGNLLALRQENVKRLLAYSSVAHLGYLLVALLAGARLGVSAAIFYIASYFATTLVAFGVVAAISGAERDADSIADYRGMFWRHPLLGGAFAVSILSLAGIPVTAGFIGKFYLVLAGVDSGLISLVIILVLNSALGLYYYLRLLAALFSTPIAAAERGWDSPERQSGRLGATVLVILSLFVLGVGIYPSPMLRWVDHVVVKP